MILTDVLYCTQSLPCLPSCPYKTPLFSKFCCQRGACLQYRDERGASSGRATRNPDRHALRGSAHAAARSARCDPSRPAEDRVYALAVVPRSQPGQPAPGRLGVAARRGWPTCRPEVVREPCRCPHKSLVPHDLLDRGAHSCRRHHELLPRDQLGKGGLPRCACSSACRLPPRIPADCQCEPQPCAQRGGEPHAEPRCAPCAIAIDRRHHRHISRPGRTSPTSMATAPRLARDRCC